MFERQTKGKWENEAADILRSCCVFTEKRWRNPNSWQANWSAFIKCSWIFLLQVKQQHFKFSASLHFHFLVLCNWSSFSFPHSLLCSRTNQDWNRLRQLIEERTCLLFWLCRKPQDLFYQFIQVCCLTASLGGKKYEQINAYKLLFSSTCKKKPLMQNIYSQAYLDFLTWFSLCFVLHWASFFTQLFDVLSQLQLLIAV